MDYRVQYAKTTDGVNIAYGEAGTGETIIVIAPAGFCHVVEITATMFPSVLAPLAEVFHTIWFDGRGSGLSDRDVDDFSLEALTLDLEAVVARTQVDSFAIAAWTNVVPVAIKYAVAHPERVSHLILVDGWAKGTDWRDTPAAKASAALRELDWSLYTETFGQVLWSYTDSAFGRRFAELMRASTQPEAHKALWKAAENYDVSELVPQVSVPTLWIHSKNNRLYPAAAGRRVAADIPGTNLALIEDDATYVLVPGLIKTFLSEGRMVAPGIFSGTAIILFADIVDSTALTERLGDAAFREKARDLDAAMRAAIGGAGGTAIEGKLLGDGILAVFTSSRDAIATAFRCRDASRVAGLELHLGLHAGDVIREENNVYGGAVNIAARISALSAPGEVLVSDTVRSLARTSARVEFVDRGEQALKGIEEPVRVWAVRPA
jgi:class 3 adenylate cyclase